MIDDMDEILREFLIESYEMLDALDRDLVALEQAPDDRELLGGIFRAIHTIKGTCGFLALGNLERVAHAGETLLSALRDGTMAVDEPVASALLATVDAVREMVELVQLTGSDGDNAYAELVSTLKTLLANGTGTAPAADPEGPPATPPTPPASVPQAVEVSSPAPAQPEASAPPAKAKQTANNTPKADAKARGLADSTIRVDVDLLDKLMNLVGELVLARNQLLQFSSGSEDNVFQSTAQQLNLITTELQEGVMKTRMQPIKTVWNKYPRVVRDVAHLCHKQVRVEMIGEDTELDKTLLEAIKDPLTHMVRNSVDHGIETPEVRAAAGKPEEGVLTLRAYHEGGQVNIEISDDGGGINEDAVRERAISRGLLTADAARLMSQRELVNMVFAPGFSTAEAVTNISGRGVGMDVVRTNIEKIGGSVDIQSVRGKGTTMKVKIPLTLAIIPALIVTSGSECFALPQVSLLELVRLEGEAARSGVEFIHGVPVYRLRGRILPLVDLNDQLKLEGRATLTVEGSKAKLDIDDDQSVSIIVLSADERVFGLVVDEINDTEEIVVKPLGKLLKGLRAYSGATIMGDGRVALILDVLGLAQRAGVIQERHGNGRAGHEAQAEEAGQGDKQTLLLFQAGDERMAIPLALVARLEEFDADKLERSAGVDVLQYRGQILPMVRLADFLGRQSTADPTEPLKVLVYRSEGQSVGLVVDDILDIVEDHFTLHRRRGGGSPGILGTTVVQGQVTDVLDVVAVVERSNTATFETVTDFGDHWRSA